jgi:hypothetical protein
MIKFNDLTFIEFTEPKIRRDGFKRTMAKFKCNCGNEITKEFSSVKSGYPKMCPICSKNNANLKITKHGKLKHKLYRKWQDMLNRCRNPKVERYKNYGGRGIKVCQEWKNNFESYYEWCINNGWEDSLQVDRIDVNGNYEPKNCRIVKPIEQVYNKQNTFYIYYNDKKYSLAKICNLNNVNYFTIRQGLKNGKSFDYYVKKLNILIFY